MQYEKQVTEQDIQRIKDRLAKYQLEILHDDGLYRHLYYSWPSDPYGRNNCSFHVITAPNTVTIYGDWMNAYTLHREPDMLRDFLNVSRVDYSYWAEKLDMANKHNSIKSIDEELFMREVEEYLNEYYDDDEEKAENYLEQIRDIIQFDSAYAHPITQLLDIKFWETDYSDTNATDIFDYEDTFGEHYTHEWVRVCLALQWAANTYCAKVSDTTKQAGCLK